MSQERTGSCSWRSLVFSVVLSLDRRPLIRSLWPHGCNMPAGQSPQVSWNRRKNNFNPSFARVRESIALSTCWEEYECFNTGNQSQKTLFLHVVRNQPGFAPACARLGLQYLQLGRVQEAVGELRETFRLDPKRWDEAGALVHILQNQAQTASETGHWVESLGLLRERWKLCHGQSARPIRMRINGFTFIFIRRCYSGISANVEAA